MNFIWHVDGIYVTDVTTNHWEGQQLFTMGLAFYQLPTERLPFHWKATVTPMGWNVSIHKMTGQAGEYQGSTFNLPLEIATAAKRLL